MMERIVNLDGAETLGAVIQHLVVGDVSKIERSSPLRIVPAGCSDVGLLGHAYFPPTGNS